MSLFLSALTRKSGIFVEIKNLFYFTTITMPSFSCSLKTNQDVQHKTTR